MNKATDFFAQGQRDCREDIEPRSQSAEYLSGWEYEYSVLESKTWIQEQQEKNNGK